MGAYHAQYVKGYLLTYGIIMATAMLVVLFEVLPLTTSCTCLTAKGMTMYKEEDEHIIAVVPLMENNVLLNENTSLPATTKNNNSSSTSNIRIEEEEIVEALEKDARRRGISIQSLVNDV
jgi:hypothetical protein